MRLGLQEAEYSVACLPSFLPLYSLLLNHVSARTFHCITENGNISTALISYHLPRNLTHPHSHSAVGRIALWSFHCMKVVDKWQTWPRYLCVTGSGDVLKFLSLRKILYSEKRSFLSLFSLSCFFFSVLFLSCFIRREMWNQLYSVKNYKIYLQIL